MLNDYNLRVLGLIDINQSIVVEGFSKSVSKKENKKKPKERKAKRSLGIRIIEASDEERTQTDSEPMADLSGNLEESGEKRKGKAAVSKKLKSKGGKSVDVFLPASGVMISEAAPSHSRDSLKGLDDIPIPDYISISHNPGLEELQDVLNMNEPFPLSAVNTSGRFGGLHIYTHFHGTS